MSLLKTCDDLFGNYSMAIWGNKLVSVGVIVVISIVLIALGVRGKITFSQDPFNFLSKVLQISAGLTILSFLFMPLALFLLALFCSLFWFI